MELGKEALQYIVGLGDATEHKIADRTYTDKSLHMVVDPVFPPVQATTLTGLNDLLQADIEQFQLDQVVIHVIDHETVALVKRVSDKFGRRPEYVRVALVKVQGFQFGQWMDHEQFIIGLMSHFTDQGDRDYLVRIASNLTNEVVTTSQDDGITQKVGQQAGVALKSTEAIRNRVVLAPFRTFREVQQPASEFVFRVRQRGDEVPSLALFEADGGKWKLAAMQEIGRYVRALGTNIPVVV